MTTEQIKARIKSLETSRFYIAIKDFWDPEDYDRDRKLSDEIISLKTMLN